MQTEGEPTALWEALASPDQPYPRAAGLCALRPQGEFSSENRLLKGNYKRTQGP